MFVSGIEKPLASHLDFIQDKCSSSTSKSISKALQITSFVKSSSVGPIPPHEIITSFLSNNFKNSSFMISFLSGTVTSEDNIKPLL